MLKKILISILLIIIATGIWQWDWLVYGVQQAKGQIKVIAGAKPINHFLNNPEYPDSLKQKLQLAIEVRLFAIDSLGLKNSKNYTSLYDQQGEVLLWNVSASEPYALKAYEWNFPFLGSMPYKGFFDLEIAKMEAKKLKKAGYDVRIRPVGGWSTLGILNDPLLSNMLFRNDGALAEVIIHELTHATLFVKNEIEFNENLASFIGEKGAELFLNTRFGKDSPELKEYLESEADQKTLTSIILRGAKHLDSLYATLNDQIPKEYKDTLKTQSMRKITRRLDSADFYNDRYYNIFSENLPNNAYFMAFRRYHDQEDSIMTIYAKHGEDIKQMLEAMKSKYGK